MIQSYTIRIFGYIIAPIIAAVACYYIAATYFLSEPMVAKGLATAAAGLAFSIFDLVYRWFLTENRLMSPIFAHEDVPTMGFKIAYIPYWVLGLIVMATGFALMLNP